MRFQKTRALAIKKKEFGESDRVISFFTEDFGKLEFYVKGIRKSRKRDLSAFEVLSLSEITIYKNGEDYQLNNIDLKEYYLEIRNDIEKLEIVSYLLDVVNKVVLHNENKKDFFERILKSLNFIIKNEYKKNLYLLLKLLKWIIRNEGFEILVEGSESFNIAESKIENSKDKKGIDLNEILYRLLTNEKENMELISIDELVKAIEIYEKYLNYHLELKIDLKKHILFGGTSC